MNIETNKMQGYWNEFAKNLGAKPYGIETVWQWIVNAYSETHRRYHTLAHIDHCLWDFDWLRRGYSKESNDAIEMSIWFHDIEYDTFAFDNEERSVKLARNALGVLGIDDPLLKAKVSRLILCTKHSSAPREPITEEEDVFLDIDLAILGSAPIEFSQFEADIRKEYEWVPSEIYCTKRAEILQSFLDRPKIYNTIQLRSVYEESARTNLTRAIHALKAQTVRAQQGFL